MTFDYYRAAKAAAVLAMATCACLLLLDARALVKAQNGVAQREGAKTRDLADRHLKQVEQDLRLREDAALAEVKALHASADRQLTEMRTTINARLGDTLVRYDRTEKDANARLAEITGTVAGLRADLKPSLTNVQTITGNFAALTGKDGDLPGAFRDTRVFMARAARAAGHIEQASDAFEAGVKDFHADLPKYLALGVGIGEDVHGITGNIKKLTTPKWYDRALGYGLTGLAIYRDLNPGYNLAEGIRGVFTKRPEQPK
jgi:hypothetical protein